MSVNNQQDNILSDSVSDLDDLSISEGEDNLSVPNSNIHDQYLNHHSDIGTDDLNELDLDLNDEDLDVTSDNQNTHTIHTNHYTDNTLTSEFYRNIPYIAHQESSLNRPGLFTEITETIQKTFSNTLDEFHNYQEPEVIANIPLKDKLPPPNISDSLVTMKTQIDDVKYLVKIGYLNLLEAETKVVKEINELDKMKSLTSQLVDFYSLLDDTELQERFKDVTIDAYKQKLNNDSFQDKLYLYRYLLNKHRSNIKCLKDINLLNNTSLCPLCFQNQIDHVVLPCGHTFCKVCLDKCKNCGVCRGNINHKHKIYIL